MSGSSASHLVWGAVEMDESIEEMTLLGKALKQSPHDFGGIICLIFLNSFLHPIEERKAGIHGEIEPAP